MTIVEFLRARYDEDEATARAASDYGDTWTGSSGAVFPSDEANHPGALLTGAWGELEDRYVEHIARHDPARVLREVEAKRRIVALHEGGHECSVYDHNGDIDNCRWCIDSEDCSTLRLLALPYADHSDHDPAWAV